MKKCITILSGIIAVIVLTVSCEKANKDNPTDSTIPDASSVELITISAKLSEALTKVSFDPVFDSNSKPLEMAHTWQNGDQLKITDASDETNYKIFDLISGEDTAEGVFQGEAIEASSYNVEAIPVGSFDTGNAQTQASDGSTAHLEFVASATGVTDLSNIELNEVSNIIGIIAKLPEGAAETVNELEIETSVDDFATSTKLNVEITTVGDTDNDDILKVYANVPASWGIPAGSKMFLRFKSTDSSHTVYTRYQEFASAATITSGKFNYIKLNCSNTDKYAGGADAGTSAAPYLIADPYQLAAVNELATGGQTTYFKMIADVDMKGVTHNHINTNSGYTQVVNFNGNGKTISNLGKDLFYVLKGSVYDFTLDKSEVTARGILAEYIQGSGNEVTNVTVSNGKVNSSSSNVGGLIGQINKGVSGQMAATITDCTVTGTDVTGKGVVGGVIGYSNTADVTISGCSYDGGTVTASETYCGGAIGSTGDFAAEISDCHVTNATVTSSKDRVGGFIGQIGRNGVTVKGCTAGTESLKVAVHSSLSGTNVHMGGFVGVCYGTVTKNGDVRSKAYTTITSGNTDTGKYVNIGGFVGYLDNGTVEYSDADATISDIKGHQVGGFAGVLTSGGVCKVDNCTANATVSGNNYVAGFIGQAAAADHVVTNNTSAGTVSGAATVAGFVGLAAQGTWTKNSTSCTVTASGANSGNFAGQLNGNVTVSKCFCTGAIIGNGNVCGGFTGIASNGATINDCYSTSSLSGGTRKRGGIAGYVDAGTVSINRCYTTSNISNNFEMGGLVGFVNVETFTMTKCAAWNGTIVASSRASNNWSSAACVGVTYLTCTLTDNYRSPNMDSLIYWGTNSGCSINLPNTFQHPDVSASAPLTDPDGNAVTSSTMRPYQGKCDASKTLSQLASTTLGWSSDVWDFTGDLPTLK